MGTFDLLIVEVAFDCIAIHAACIDVLYHHPILNVTPLTGA